MTTYDSLEDLFAAHPEPAPAAPNWQQLEDRIAADAAWEAAHPAGEELDEQDEQDD